jgi:hypothetical protein
MDSMELRNHRWFKNFDWQALFEKKLESPFLPDITNEGFIGNFDEEFIMEAPRDTNA